MGRCKSDCRRQRTEDSYDRISAFPKGFHFL
jgi:hypothetical protein